MLLIFPFEEKIYKDHGIPATYIGHPLIETLKISLSKEEFLRKYRVDHQRKLISILPGSRRSEIKFHMPVLLKALQKIRNEFSPQFLLLLAENLEPHPIYKSLPTSVKDLKVLAKDKYEAMAYSDLVLAACGTANLEAALLDVPLISFYRILPLTFFLGHKFVHIKDYSIVNILAGKRIVPELIQNHFTPENIFQETKKILDSEESRSKMREGYKSIKILLGKGQASQNAARELAKTIVFYNKSKINEAR